MQKLLFLCVTNATRSAMAEGLARLVLGSSVSVQSAGAQPAPRVNPCAVKVLAELGVDISTHKPRATTEVEPGSFDLAIYLCADEACPTELNIADGQKLLWPLPDPADARDVPEAEALIHFRAARDRILMKLKDFQQRRSG